MAIDITPLTRGTIDRNGGEIRYQITTSGSCDGTSVSFSGSLVQYTDGVSAVTNLSNGYFTAHTETNPSGNFVVIGCPSLAEGDFSDHQVLWKASIGPTGNKTICDAILISQIARECDCSGLVGITSIPILAAGCVAGTPIATFDYGSCDTSHLRFTLVGGPSVSISGNNVVVNGDIPEIESYLPYLDFPLIVEFKSGDTWVDCEKNITVRQEGKIPCSCQNTMNYRYTAVSRLFDSGGTWISGDDYATVLVASGYSSCGIIKANDPMSDMFHETPWTVNDGNYFYVYTSINKFENYHYPDYIYRSSVITYNFQKNGGTEIDYSCQFISLIEQTDHGCDCQNGNDIVLRKTGTTYGISAVSLKWRGFNNRYDSNPTFNVTIPTDYGQMILSPLPYKDYGIGYGGLHASHVIQAYDEGSNSCMGFDVVGDNDNDVVLIPEVKRLSASSNEIVAPFFIKDNISLTSRIVEFDVAVFNNHHYEARSDGKIDYTKGTQCGPTYHVSLQQQGAPNPTCAQIFPSIASTAPTSTDSGFSISILTSSEALGGVYASYNNALYSNYVFTLKGNTDTDNDFYIAPNYTNSGKSIYDYFIDAKTGDPFGRWSIEKLTTDITIGGITYARTADWVEEIIPIEEVYRQVYCSSCNPLQFSRRFGKFTIKTNSFVADSSCVEGDTSRCTNLLVTYDNHSGTTCFSIVRYKQSSDSPTPPTPDWNCENYYKITYGPNGTENNPLPITSGGNYKTVASIAADNGGSISNIQIISVPSFVTASSVGSSDSIGVKTYTNDGEFRSGTIRISLTVSNPNHPEGTPESKTCELSFRIYQDGTRLCHYGGSVSIKVWDYNQPQNQTIENAIHYEINTNGSTSAECYSVRIDNPQSSYIEGLLANNPYATEGNVNLITHNCGGDSCSASIDFKLLYEGAEIPSQTYSIVFTLEKEQT